MKAWWVLLTIALAPSSGALTAIPQDQDPNLVFRTGVERVTLNVVVRDRQGRPVTGLTREDFWIMDSGKVTPITDFRTDDQPISLGLLIDGSGSMEVGTRFDEARQASEMLLEMLRPGVDEAALYTFDSALHEQQAFTKDVATFQATLRSIRPFGTTSLHDAIAAAAQRVVAHQGLRRAVIVITDGIDTSSELTAAEASAIASEIDVPIYVVAVVSPLDHVGNEDAVIDAAASVRTGDLMDLARATGGALFLASAPAHASVAMREIVTDLRQAYLVAFEPGLRLGWHRIIVRALRTGVTVRTRIGFWVGPARPS